MSRHEANCCEEAPASALHRTLVPAEKALPTEWLESLCQRGEPEIFAGKDLRYIGMPVGGICTGQVYLGGDGQLWHWDIFKAYGGSDEEIDPRGLHYPNPPLPASPIQQGFALALESSAGGRHVRPLSSDGYSDIRFEGRYPMGEVKYDDPDFPIRVTLAAYSPFIPLDPDDSGLPGVVLEYSLENHSDVDRVATIFGWLENKICRYDDRAGNGLRRNELRRDRDAARLFCEAVSIGNSNPADLEGFGDMTLTLIDDDGTVVGCPVLSDETPDDGGKLPERVFDSLSRVNKGRHGTRPFGTETIGALGRELLIGRGRRRTVRFLITWYFPRYSGGYVFHSTMEDLPNLSGIRRYYASRFESSLAVSEYMVEHFDRLSVTTRCWTDTWFDSSLPTWLLNRASANTATLATQTCHRFDDGRFYAWEGVDCCPGTCQHVWQYAQTVSRLFPSLERWVREHVDYGIAYRSDGSIEYRAEANSGAINMASENDSEAFFAADGQLGTILRVYREHTMSSDDAFLRRLWPRVRHSLKFIAALDSNGDGLLDKPQFHTLDTSWYGEIPWISSLYLAGLAAGREMATDLGDSKFARWCALRLDTGRRHFVEKLFNGEYFVHIHDQRYPDAMNLTEGSYIDQVFGQGYALQLGLGRILPKDETLLALRSIWKYNFTPDVGNYRAGFKEVEGGRWYAMPGEGGVLMCTWPRDDCNRAGFEQKILGLDVTSEGYLNECMSGFEYQLASHMVAEGMVQEGLAIMRTVHDRYHPSKRNPFNEVECSDHYSRAMASYGIFLNLCGYRYHGPKGELGFSPKISRHDFRAPFTTAEGWGSYAQTISGDAMEASFSVRYGKVDLRAIELAFGAEKVAAMAVVDGQTIETVIPATDSGQTSIEFPDGVSITEGSTLAVSVSRA